MDVVKNKKLIDSVVSIQNGNADAFNEFYQYTSDYVYKRAKFVMKDEEDALDLMQETFVQAYKNITALQKPENVYAWLGAICYRQGMRIFRDKKEILVDEEAEGIFDDIISEDLDTKPEESSEAKETSEIVMSLIEELPPLQKAVVVAFYYDNKKIDDIASEMECSSNTVKSRLNYAKKYLKEKVEAHEKVHGYRLHSVTPFVMAYAFKKLFAQSGYSIAASTSAKVCGAVVGATGAGTVASTLTTASTASAVATSTTTAATTTAATTAAATTASTVATVGIGAKIGIGVAVAAVSAGLVFGVVNNGGNPAEPTTIIETTMERPTPAPYWPPQDNTIVEIKSIEGVYKVYGRTSEPHIITISNISMGDMGGMQADIDYNGLGVKTVKCSPGYEFSDGLIYTDSDGNTYSLVIQCMSAKVDRSFIMIWVSGTITDSDGNVTDIGEGGRSILFSKDGVVYKE